MATRPTKEQMQKILDQVEVYAQTIIDDLPKVMTNKAAAKRVRQATSRLGSGIGKLYRKASVEFHRKGSEIQDWEG